MLTVAAVSAMLRICQTTPAASVTCELPPPTKKVRTGVSPTTAYMFDRLLSGDPDAAVAGLAARGCLYQPCRGVRARDPLRHAPRGTLGKHDHGPTGRTVGKHACVGDRPVEVASAKQLLAGALVFDHGAHGQAGEEP